ncbi:MAG: methylated-DNA--[protein]-cysteine S-methyltransferase [Ignavibacteria bacterium]|nr:methylated-DNA--[protein]-cysteine S-methyltransferase [Ignavibacteria bacterium]
MISDEFFSTSFEIAGISFSVIATRTGIGFLLLNQPLKKEAMLPSLSPNAAEFFGIYDQLLEYFAGTRKTFDIPLDMEGTPFQKKVWKQLTRIPYGKTVSYKDVAVKIKQPEAVRAVGMANGANPVPIIVPCHRVINANGKLGGYSGGLDIKIQLLDMEKKNL